MSHNVGRKERLKSEIDLEIQIPQSTSSKTPKAEDLASRAITLLRIPFTARTSNQIETLKSALQITFFTNLREEHGEEILDQSIKKLKHEFYNCGKIVFNIGIVSGFEKGSVGVCIKLPKKAVPQNEEDQNSPSLAKQKWHKQPPPQQQQTQQQDPQAQPELTEVNVLRAGAYFGELALLNDALRTATIVCKEDTDFAVLDATDFKEILGTKGQWQIQKDIQFLVNIPFFALLQRRHISTLIYHFQTLNFRRNNTIYREGEEARFIYIIKKGEIKLFQKVDFHVEEDTFHPVDDTKKHKLNFTKSVEVAILGPNETFGEEEVYLNSKRQVSAVCVSNEAEFFALSVEDFSKRILCNEEFATVFEQDCQNKIYLRNRRVESIVNTKDKNKEMLFGKNGITILPSSTKNSSPNKPRAAEQYRTVSPSHRTRKPSMMKTPKQSGAPARILDRKASHLAESKKRPTVLMTEADSITTVLFSRQQTRFKEGLPLFSTKHDPNDLFRDTPTRRLKTDGTSPIKSMLSRRSARPRRGGPNHSRLDESISSPSPTKPDRPTSRTIKLEINEDTAALKNSLLGEIDQSFLRKYFSTKTPQRGLREEQIVLKYVDSKEKVIKVLNENSMQPMDEPQNIDFESALFKKPVRIVRDERFKTPPSHPSRQMTLSQRIQNQKQRAASTKRETEPQKSVNMHMEKFRLNQNFNCFFKMQARVINHITTESPELSFLPTRTNTLPSYYNPLMTENDLSGHKFDSNQDTDRPIMIRALVNSRQIL